MNNWMSNLGIYAWWIGGNYGAVTFMDKSGNGRSLGGCGWDENEIFVKDNISCVEKGCFYGGKHQIQIKLIKSRTETMERIAQW